MEEQLTRFLLKNLDERLEDLLDEKLEDLLDEKLGDMVEEKLEAKLDARLEEIADDKLQEMKTCLDETRLEELLEEKVEKLLEEKLSSRRGAKKGRDGRLSAWDRHRLSLSMLQGSPDLRDVINTAVNRARNRAAHAATATPAATPAAHAQSNGRAARSTVDRARAPKAANVVQGSDRPSARQPTSAAARTSTHPAKRPETHAVQQPAPAAGVAVQSASRNDVVESNVKPANRKRPHDGQHGEPAQTPSRRSSRKRVATSRD
ncbi:hypothetical protein B0A49_13681 [Cryomyces minteri]|uniref:Uncharacterized protein n=1 Tax=Cryomyces minteri TaxID=331657 RepID=A0A4U0V6T8_9PEZI|nr:hypothetical protein B0A49_13681 [Cryomyces minteri]